jgi:hypothetical protein
MQHALQNAMLRDTADGKGSFSDADSLCTFPTVQGVCIATFNV